MSSNPSLKPADSSSDLISIQIMPLPHAEELPLPTYATPQSAGLDLYAAISGDVVIQPGQIAKIPTGFSLALPKGYEAQIRSRSGLAAKHGVVILNAPGTIDADYRGEVIGILINHGTESFTVTRGMRFAQMVIAAHATVAWQECASLEDHTTVRGTGKFGSTGY